MLDDKVRLLVKFVPVTMNVLDLVLFLTTLPKFSCVSLVVMAGITPVPVMLTYLVGAFPPLILMDALCEPTAVGV